jgi:hypothetical protein
LFDEAKFVSKPILGLTDFGISLLNIHNYDS